MKVRYPCTVWQWRAMLRFNAHTRRGSVRREWVDTFLSDPPTSLNAATETSGGHLCVRRGKAVLADLVDRDIRPGASVFGLARFDALRPPHGQAMPARDYL